MLAAIAICHMANKTVLGSILKFGNLHDLLMSGWVWGASVSPVNLQPGVPNAGPAGQMEPLEGETNPVFPIAHISITDHGSAFILSLHMQNIIAFGPQHGNTEVF